MKSQFRPLALSVAVGCAAVAILGALSAAATAGWSSAQPGASQPATTTTTSNMSYRPLVTASPPAPPT